MLLVAEIVSPTVGAELTSKGLSATAFSLVGILIYLAFRFQFSFGVGAVVATIHDLLITLAFLAFFRYDMTLNVIAAILTMTGFSTNDTIVIFDRIRENLRSMRRDSMHQVINASVNQTLNRTVIGGSACPPAMISAFREDYGVDVLHAWGMTEMSPLGTLCTLKNKHLSLPAEEQMKIRLKQGRAIFGVEMEIVGDDGQPQPHDGVAYGDLMVKGPWVIREYFKGEGGNPLREGWFPTGDVGTIDADGFLQITDRSKDVIKSGGEWISSIDIENIAMAHPAVAMAAGRR